MANIASFCKHTAFCYLISFASLCYAQNSPSQWISNCGGSGSAVLSSCLKMQSEMNCERNSPGEHCRRVLEEAVAIAERQQKAFSSQADLNAAEPKELSGSRTKGITIFGIEVGAIVSLPVCSSTYRTDTTCISSAFHKYDDGQSSSTWGMKFSADAKPSYLVVDGRSAAGGAPDVKLRFVDGLVEGMSFRVYAGSGTSPVVSAFNTKFGSTIRESVPMQNAAGAKWTGDLYKWQLGDIVAQLQCLEFPSEAASCSVDVSTKTYTNREASKARRSISAETKL